MSAQREHWGSRLGFILAAAGSAIGLGTMWKLPYIMGQNGGGAFILLFLIFNFLVGVPLFIGELLIGRKSQRGVVGTFEKLTNNNDSSWKLVGWLAVLASFIIMGWYCVVAGWGMNYVILALCDSFKGKSAAEIGQIFEIFRASGDLNVLWQIIFIAINAVIVISGLSKGIEYWSKLMTTSLFVVLVLLSIYSSTLPGFNQAIEYILYPDFTALTATSVLKALALSLFTLSLGYGVMITYGSYMQSTEDIPKTSLIVGAANFIISIMIAIMIFPMVFTFNIAPSEGEGLIFKTLPYVFEQLPGSILISVMFFTLLIFAALTSSLSMLEVSVANFIDLNGWTRKKAVAVSSVITFIIGLPTALSGAGVLFPNWEKIFGQNFLNTCDTFSDWLLCLIALFTAIFIGFYLDKEVRQKAFAEGTTIGFLYKPWAILIRWVVPFGILVVIGQRAHLINFEAILNRLF